MSRRCDVLALIALLPAILFGCGNDSGSAVGRSTDQEGLVSSQQKMEVEDAIGAYFSAPTADGICDHMTVGLVASLNDAPPPIEPAKPAGSDCPRAIKRAAKRGEFLLEPTEVEIQAVAVDGDAAAARIVNEAFSSEPYGVFLFDSGGRWLVHAEGAVLPGFEELWEQVRE